MPQLTPVQTVQAAYAAFGSGDIPGLLSHLSDEVEWHFVCDRRAPYNGTVRGKEAVAQWFGQVAAADGIQVFEAREFHAGPGHVTVIGWERTAALPCGKVFEAEWVHVWSVCDGLVTRLWGMLDTEAAAAARA